MDAALLAIARAADQGEARGLSLLTADGSILEGVASPARALADSSEGPLIDEGALRLAGGKAKKAGQYVSEVRQQVTRELDAVRRHVSQSEPSALTLSPAHWTPQHGQFQLRLPVIRVPLATVTAWWLVGGEVIEEVRQGGSWFVGGLFPLGN